MKFKTPFIKPLMPNSQELSRAYETIVESNWFTNFGPQEQKFSKKLEEFIGQDTHVTTVANATLGLILAVKALMIPSGDKTKKKVLIPSFTFAAVAESLEWCGLQPVYVDVDDKSWQMKLSEADQYINDYPNEVLGILFCNIFGVGAPEIDKWEMLARKHKLPIIIDSAAGFGSRYKDGDLLGARGDCEIFSFHATKPFGIGEGGAIASQSKEVISKIKSLENFGFSDKREVNSVGLNAKLQEINASIGLWRLKNIETSIKRRQHVHQKFADQLAPLGYTFQDNAEQSSVCFVSAIAKSDEQAIKSFEALRSNGVEANRYYNPPLHKQTAFKNYERVSILRTTDNICNRILSLPAHHDVSDVVLDKIVSIIKEANYRK